MMKDNSIEIKYEEVLRQQNSLDQQFRMYSPQPLGEEQLSQYTVQYLQNKENANKVFERSKSP
jgi:trigger factor